MRPPSPKDPSPYRRTWSSRRRVARSGDRHPVGPARRGRGQLAAAAARRDALGADEGDQRSAPGRPRLRRRPAGDRAAPALRGPAAAARAAARTGHRRHRDPRLRRHRAGRLVRGLAGHGQPRRPLQPPARGHQRAQELGTGQSVPRDREADQRHREEPQRDDRHQHRGDHLRRAPGRDGPRRGADGHAARDVLDALPALRRPAHLALGAGPRPGRRPPGPHAAPVRAPGAP